jgi:hypothetical protein
MSDRTDNAAGAAIVFSFASGIAITMFGLMVWHREWGWAAFGLLTFLVLAVATVRADAAATGGRS